MSLFFSLSLLLSLPHARPHSLPLYFFISLFLFHSLFLSLSSYLYLPLSLTLSLSLSLSLSSSLFLPLSLFLLSSLSFFLSLYTYLSLSPSIFLSSLFISLFPYLFISFSLSLDIKTFQFYYTYNLLRLHKNMSQNIKKTHYLFCAKTQALVVAILTTFAPFSFGAMFYQLSTNMATYPGLTP